MAAVIRLADEGLEVEFPAGDAAAMAKAGPFLIVVMKADKADGKFALSGGEAGRTIEALIRFLEKNSIQFELEPTAERFLAEVEASHEEFEEARATGSAAEAASGSRPTAGFVRQLTSQQVESVRHLLDVKNGANFSVPGAGKTSIALATYHTLRTEHVVDRLIVVAPRAAFLPWEDEFEACFGSRPVSVRLTGDPAARERIYSRSADYELFLVTYQMAANDAPRLVGLCRRHPVLLVLDESHHVKRLDEGQWAAAVLKLAPFAKRRLVLSGTPMPQGYEDLWTQFTFLWPRREVLGEKNAFRRQCERDQTDDIKSSVRPFFRRITKGDLNLPKMTVERLEVDLAPHQARIYEAIRERILGDLELQPAERRLLRRWRRARLIRLLQTASNPALLSEHSDEFDLPISEASDMNAMELARQYERLELPSKFATARDLVAELTSAGKKVVVWTSFVKNISMFAELVRELAPVFVVYGAVPKDYTEDEEFNREQQIDHFKKADGGAILVANPAACGESISLHRACREAIYIDRTFDCAKFLQSQDRIHRLGLQPGETVRLRILLCSDTIDETIDARLETKAERMRDLFEGEFPQGTFSDVDESEAEEEVDFEAAMSDLRRAKR